MALYQVTVVIVLEDEGRIEAWDTVAKLVAPLREEEAVKAVSLEGLRADDFRRKE